MLTLFSGYEKETPILTFSWEGPDMAETVDMILHWLLTHWQITACFVRRRAYILLLTPMVTNLELFPYLAYTPTS
jgi:hypothetical protein